MSREAPTLPAKLAPNPKQLAQARSDHSRQLKRRAGIRAGGVLVFWAVLAVFIGLSMSVGELVHAGWLMIMGVAAFLSPAAIVVLRRIKLNYEADRVALAQAEDDPTRPTHLRPSLLKFYENTHLARAGLSDALEPGECVRLLWDWRRGFEGLGPEDQEQLRALGVGLGPIAQLLDAPDRTGALSQAQRHEAEVHLLHVEQLLASEPEGAIYR